MRARLTDRIRAPAVMRNQRSQSTNRPVFVKPKGRERSAGIVADNEIAAERIQTQVARVAAHRRAATSKTGVPWTPPADAATVLRVISCFNDGVEDWQGWMTRDKRRVLCLRCRTQRHIAPVERSRIHAERPGATLTIAWGTGSRIGSDQEIGHWVPPLGAPSILGSRFADRPRALSCK